MYLGDLLGAAPLRIKVIARKGQETLAMLDQPRPGGAGGLAEED